MFATAKELWQGKGHRPSEELRDFAEPILDDPDAYAQGHVVGKPTELFADMRRAAEEQMGYKWYSPSEELELEDGLWMGVAWDERRHGRAIVMCLPIKELYDEFMPDGEFTPLSAYLIKEALEAIAKEFEFDLDSDPWALDVLSLQAMKVSEQEEKTILQAWKWEQSVTMSKPMADILSGKEK